jgi:pilus assembly protein Flp/PilA
VLKLLDRLFREEEGQGLVEYALIIALIAVACIVAIEPVREAIKTVFTNIANGLNSTTTTP